MEFGVAKWLSIQTGLGDLCSKKGLCSVKKSEYIYRNNS